VVADDRHTGGARETILHDAHFRTIPVDRQLSDAPLPLGLDQSALDAVRKWKFRPGTLNGQPVPVIYNLTVIFRLQ